MGEAALGGGGALSALTVRGQEVIAFEDLQTEAIRRMELEDFLHGSWQPLDGESLVFVIATKGRAHARALDLMRAARVVGARVVAVAEEGDREVADRVDTVLEVPAVDELLSPFLNIIPLYLFAYYSSVERGHNPDCLRYLDPTYWEARRFIFPPGTH